MKRAVPWLALIALIAAGAAYWHLSPSFEHPELSGDLYPLYAATSWQEPKSENFHIGTTSYSGTSITSNAIEAGMDPGSIFMPFEQYYDQKLRALGWSIANDLAAGGHVGGQTGYRKEGQIILTRFSVNYKNRPADAPSECPCSVTLSLFSSTQ